MNVPSGLKIQKSFSHGEATQTSPVAGSMAGQYVAVSALVGAAFCHARVRAVALGRGPAADGAALLAAAIGLGTEVAAGAVGLAGGAGEPTAGADASCAGAEPQAANVAVRIIPRPRRARALPDSRVAGTLMLLLLVPSGGAAACR